MILAMKTLLSSEIIIANKTDNPCGFTLHLTTLCDQCPYIEAEDTEARRG